MKKTIASFLAVHIINAIHHFFPGKTNNGSCCEKPLHFGKAVAVVIAAVISVAASAQCLTFHNADSANPLLHASPMPHDIYNLQFVDIDADGDLDCYLYEGGTGLVLYRNVGNKYHPQFTLCPTNGFENTSLTDHASTFSFADLDGDGDLDFITWDAQANTSGGHGGGFTFTQYYQNTGTPQTPAFVKSNGPVSDGSSSPLFFFIDLSFQDVDGDGDLDFYVANNDYGGPVSHVDLNTGSNAVPSYSYYMPIDVFGNLVYATFHDFTGDGLPDLIQYDNNNNIFFRPNMGTISTPLFTLQFYDGPRPDFGGVAPKQFVDLNGDGALEEFSRSGHYGTLAPVAVITSSTRNIAGHAITKLSATQTSASYSYRWEFNGKTISGYGKPFIYALKKGSYTLHITDTCGTGVSLPYLYPDTLLTADSRIGSIGSNLSAMPVVKAYPNPFTESVQVQLPAAMTTAKVKVVVTDVSGRVLLSQPVTGTSLRLGSKLAKGMYILQLWENGRLVYHDKLIKQ